MGRCVSTCDPEGRGEQATWVGLFAQRENPGECEGSEEGGGANWSGLVGPL